MMKGLAESGANVACIDVLAETAALAVSKLAEECHVEATSWGCDVTNDEEVAMVFDSIAQHHGSIDVLVTAAGINKVCAALDYKAEEMRRIMDVNFTGTFLCAQQAAKHMIARNTRGSIVFISSMSAVITNRPNFHCAYNASKAAVSQLTRSLACEWAPYNIRVTAISPGHFETEMVRQLSADQKAAGISAQEIWESNTPMARLGQPYELKGVVAFLASEASSFVTGTEILVDGGQTAW